MRKVKIKIFRHDFQCLMKLVVGVSFLACVLLQIQQQQHMQLANEQQQQQKEEPRVGAAVPVEPGAVVAVEPGAVVAVEPKAVVPVEPGAVVPVEPKEVVPRVAVIYAYYEKNKEYKENFEYFLKYGMLPELDFYFVINGACTVEIPEHLPNVWVFRRRNTGVDFGAISYALNKLQQLENVQNDNDNPAGGGDGTANGQKEKKKNTQRHQYDYYFFINTSVRGPYGRKKWTEYFLPLFTKETKLVGTAVNVFTKTVHGRYNMTKIFGHPPPFSHVQSMFFGMDRELLLYFRGINFFNETDSIHKDFHWVIVHKEIGMSQRVLAKGWNLGCVLPEYQRDYRNLTQDFNPTSVGGEMYLPRRYFGRSVQPEDVIFFKRARMREGLFDIIKFYVEPYLWAWGILK